VLLLLLLLLLLSASRVQAQAPAGRQEARPERSYGSAYLPLGHWIYGYLNTLIARGRVTGLSPLVQPYRRIDVAAAILAARKERRLSPEEREWAAAIEAELAREVELLRGRGRRDVTLHGEAGVGFEALSQTHRDPLRPEGDEKLFPTFRLEFRGTGPGVAGAVIARWDNHYLNDPQFPNGRAVEFRACDPIVDECAYRIEEGYVEVQMPYVRVFFGRMYRNWGLPGLDGFLLSSYAYSFDQIGYRFGSDRISLTGLYAPLGDFAGDTARHFATHRFDFRPTESLVLSVGESVVYGGPNRRIDFNLTNPAGVWEISASTAGRERNALGLAEVWWRIFDDLVTYGAFMVDNTSVGDEAVGKKSGFPQWAGAFGVQLPTVTPTLALRGDVTVVSSLAYRSRVARWQFYAVDDIGLAYDRTDAVLVTLRGDWYPRRGLRLMPRLDLLWKGEDDLTDPFPADAFTTHDWLLVGVVEKTIRPSLGGLWRNPRAELRWDLGLNIVKNKDHAPGGWGAEFVGRVQGEVRVRF
jgi:hypothetical protein